MATNIPLSWLVTRIHDLSVSGIVAHEVESLASKSGLPKEKIKALVEKRPIDQWTRFLSEAEAGDELWSFGSPPKSWQNMCGTAGYALIRGGCVVSTLVTLRN